MSDRLTASITWGHHAKRPISAPATSRPYPLGQRFHSMPLWLRPRGISAIGAVHQSLRARASTSSSRSTMRRIAWAGASAPAIPCSLGVQLGVVLKFDLELGVAVRRPVGIRDRFFLVASTAFGNQDFSTIFSSGKPDTGGQRTHRSRRSAFLLCSASTPVLLGPRANRAELQTRRRPGRQAWSENRSGAVW
jgi:hypothetical protein